MGGLPPAAAPRARKPRRGALRPARAPAAPQDAAAGGGGAAHAGVQVGRCRWGCLGALHPGGHAGGSLPRLVAAPAVFNLLAACLLGSVCMLHAPCRCCRWQAKLPEEVRAAGRCGTPCPLFWPCTPQYEPPRLGELGGRWAHVYILRISWAGYAALLPAHVVDGVLLCPLAKQSLSHLTLSLQTCPPAAQPGPGWAPAPCWAHCTRRWPCLCPRRSMPQPRPCERWTGLQTKTTALRGSSSSSWPWRVALHCLLVRAVLHSGSGGCCALRCRTGLSAAGR